MVEKIIVEDPRQPCLQIGPRTELPVGIEGSDIGLLNKILRLLRFLRKMIGHPIQVIEMLQSLKGELLPFPVPAITLPCHGNTPAKGKTGVY